MIVFNVFIYSKFFLLVKENCFLICDICKLIFIYINLGFNFKINKLKGEIWKKKKKIYIECLFVYLVLFRLFFGLFIVVCRFWNGYVLVS